MGDALNSALGSPEHPLVNPAYLSMAGAVVPPLLRVLNEAKGNVSAARVPLQGALSGASSSPLIGRRKSD